ncbi:MAG: acyl-CoA dehydrogenase family protein [Burkholderiales bacterium]|nr:acyl-CoA dehydrogenase family protein [Burkholderiales bacterium]
MDFIYSDEQQQLRDSLQKYIAKEYGFEARKAIIASKQGFSDKVWAQFAEMGLLGVAFDEAHGGFGGSSVDTMLVMTELGRGMVVEPYFSTVVVGGSLIDLGGSEAQKQAILSEVVQGKLLLAAALGEPKSRYELNCVETAAKRDGAGYVLNGHKAVVLHGESADKLVVSARTAGGARDAKGISLFLVDRKSAGVAVQGYRTIDGMRAAEIKFANVKVGADGVLGEVDAALPLLERAADFAVSALCAEAVGAMEALNAATYEYLKTRQQFGRPIGSFQALQHRAVDMMIHCEQSRSLALLASVKVQSEDPNERKRTVSAAKIQIGRSGRHISEEAIQLHGGMGVSNELAAGHYAKRLTMINATLGDVDHHSERFASAA